jgi:hypothetical protein
MLELHVRRGRVHRPAKADTPADLALPRSGADERVGARGPVHVVVSIHTFVCGAAPQRLPSRPYKPGVILACDEADRAGRMSQRDVERTLGRLLTDAGFRRDFSLNPARACLVLGADLTPAELDALLQVPLRGLASLAETLDDRICRLHIEAFEDPDESRGDH